MFTVKEQEAIDYALNIIQKKVKKKLTITSASVAATYTRMIHAGKQREEFYVHFLTTANMLIESQCMFTGTINSCNVFPRDIARRALELNAKSVILSHNHPSGDCTPSNADRQVTMLIKQALNLLEIDVLDHLVVGGADVTSMAEIGMI